MHTAFTPPPKAIEEPKRASPSTVRRAPILVKTNGGWGYIVVDGKEYEVSAAAAEVVMPIGDRQRVHFRTPDKRDIWVTADVKPDKVLLVGAN